MELSAAEFPEFYRQVTGVPPFPWQTDLVGQLLSERAWPQLIDVPTGLGKSSLLDVAVFVAAATATEVGPGRLGRRRIFFVVDRRLVVDEAYTHAIRLSEVLDAALESAQCTAAGQVAAGLRRLAPTANAPLSIPAPVPVRRVARSVLPVTRMRGGVTWDAAWLDRPDLPGIVVGTIDQVGSRLLFRGYGVSDRRKPIDAALVGTDALILVDEAHLAEVMISTVVEAYRRDREGLGLPRAEVVRLTATAAATASDERLRRYTIDVDAHRDSEVAWRRLTASKRLSAVSTDSKQVVATIAEKAVGLLTAEHDTILVVCNTVDRARQVHATLAKAASRRQNPLQAESNLLIGRSRPADRELLVSRITQRFGVGRPRRCGATPAILVATQTVEVGANLDADGLVTESAPWDSLVQRFGRVNRLGDCPGTARVVVVHDGVVDGPVYGQPRRVTWEFLCLMTRQAGDGFDVSPLACRDLAAELPGGVSAARPLPPLLTSPTLESWVRTGPVPVPDTPVAPYLHGLGSDAATVSIAWRDGLVDPDPTGDDAERPEWDLTAELSALPIRSEELVEVPLHAVRRWLRGESALPLSDLDDDADPQQSVRPARESSRAVAWRSDSANDAVGQDAHPPGRTGSWVWVEADAVRPGDVLVMPTERGGLDEYGWAPDSALRVLDVSEVIRSRPPPGGWGPVPSRPLLRCDEHTGRRLGLPPEDSQEVRRLMRDLAADAAFKDSGLERQLSAHLAAAVGRVLDRAGDAPAEQRLAGTAWTPSDLSLLASWLLGPVTVVPLLDGQGRGSDRFLLASATPAAWEVDRDDELPECSSMGTGRVTLPDHHTNVGDRARAIAEALGLPAALTAAVDAAARWHDLGKTEPRFQAMLCGGDAYQAMLVDGPLAKSGIDPVDRSAYRVARERSGLPPAARHEAWSAALVRAFLVEAVHPMGFDPDLVIHLVASHHGHARPWLPPVHDDKPRDLGVLLTAPTSDEAGTKVVVNTAATVDFDHPARFARLNDTYGRWGVALLESIVRCADMTVSGEGS